ncbi:MAG TPA: hypothetical protein VLG13_02240 [Patescibacteria group bacterium]|nr:hypothetical protein [Patescibacteria group bacterium]
MVRKKFEVFVGAASLPRQDLERVFRYLARQGVEVVRVSDLLKEQAAAHEAAKKPVWVNREDFYWAGDELGMRIQQVGQAWNALGKLQLKIQNPELVEDVWQGNSSAESLPVTFDYEYGDNNQREMIVDARTLKETAMRAKANFVMKGQLGLWEYIGVTNIGLGVLDNWDSIATQLLAD